MATPVWLATVLKKIFPYRNTLAKVTHLPGVPTLMAKTIFSGDTLIYLPKDKVVVQEQIHQPGSVILPSSLVDHYIDEAHGIFIMDRCMCRDGDNCQNYPHDLGCIFLGEAVHQINPKLGRLATRAEAHAHAKACREAGLIHLIGRDRIDSLWLGAHPAGRLMTICNCCPCCCLFRVVPHMHPSLTGWVSRMPGVTVTVTEECTGCGVCTEGHCMMNAIQIRNGKAVISEACRACGRCVEACPADAIKLSIDDTRYIETAIQHISASVNVNGHKSLY